MKRLFDFLLAILLLVLISPLFILTLLAIWLQDFKNPFYVAPRVGQSGRIFNMIKLRSMVMNADKSGVDSTAADDKRITPVGSFVRKFKLDEFGQVLNVLAGTMSFVGPRPNVQRDVSLYTKEEEKLLTVKPGITDFSSIVFSDEGDILSGSSDPDLLYNQIIRPYKSRLGLHYISVRNLLMDLKLILYTGIAIVSKKKALKGVGKLLAKSGASDLLIRVSQRKDALEPYPPPGSDQIVKSREL